KTKYQPLLVASHIIPWSKDPQNRLNPKNGILLCRNHDKLFEEGQIRINIDYSISWPDAKKDFLGVDLFHFVTKRTKKHLIKPIRSYEPDPEFLKWRLLKVLSF
ncbi:MAG: HNH endonuclease, partial [Gemmatimonadota bacterium]|nr:HNH endonuclease [Gemmatimonadota bacterium]